jgi:integrase
MALAAIRGGVSANEGKREKINLLNARKVATETKPGRHRDGNGLYLSISEGGRRRWTFIYNRDGKRVEMGLGSADDVTLAEARRARDDAREKLKQGIDPLLDRNREKLVIPLFGNFADDYVATMRSQWRNEKHAEQWTMTLTRYAAPLRKMPVDSISTADVLSVLKTLWQRTPETAERLRGRIENILNAAKAAGFRSGENPAQWRGHLENLLPRRQRLSRGHHKALPYTEMQPFMVRLREREAVAAAMLEFLILTAARSGEILNARWSEISLDRGVWTVPALRMKAGREHRVPLSSDALNVLERVKPLAGQDDDPLVFPGRAGKPLSNMAMSKVLERMNLDVTAHGFRSAFRDWAAETTGFPHEVCEMALAHTIGNKAEAAYRRGDLFEKRRELMDAWASYCAEKPANVTIFRSTR